MRRRSQKHPRVCGEHYRPMTLGTRTKKHPRVFGEHYVALEPTLTKQGSPPRIRGARDFLGRTKSHNGNTPTYVGSTQHECSLAPSSKVHPRVCGEHRSSRREASLYMGSSPHMRGTPARPSPAVLVRRITPAYARNTNLAPWPLRHYDSPLTIRGTLFEHVGTHMQCGPSPSMRGTRRYPAVAVEGFTPAHAGNTRPRRLGASWRWVHPRTCGEYETIVTCFACGMGSPPHMRGIH